MTDTIIDHQYHPDYDSVIVLNNIIDSLKNELNAQYIQFHEPIWVKLLTMLCATLIAVSIFILITKKK